MLTVCLVTRSTAKRDLPLSESSDNPTSVFDVVRLLRQARGGSQHAFAQLYRRYAPLVHTILLGRFRPALADELAQECFATAFNRLSQLKEDHKFGPWIATMARRINANETLLETHLDALPEMQCAMPSPEDKTEAEQMLRTIASLPEAYRETLLLRLVEGLSGAEIASLTGLTPDSVRVNLHRGMEKLRSALLTKCVAAQENRSV